MNFTEFFIRRPAFTIVIMLVMTIVGLIGYASLPVRWIPNIAPPVVSIYTSYTGASANLVETQITTPIEAALSGIEGVESLASNSATATSQITLNFKVGRNMDAAIEDVRSSLANVTGNLPKDVTAPVVSKAQTDNIPILFLAFSDADRTAKEVSDYVDQFVIPRLQTVDGVATVITYGRTASAMRIWLDPNRMASSGVTVDDINNALMQQNIQVPSGSIRGADRFYNVVTNETLTTANQFNDLIIRADQTQTIRLKNVGEAIIAPANTDTAFRVEGQPAVAVGIVTQSTANPLDVSKRVLTTFASLKKSLPNGMKASVVYNEATFIESSIHSVYEAVIEAIIFVLIVIYLFLANWRATLIPIVTIPVCLIATFALLHFFKFSINTITLMAFVLAIGLVVDDAIVMLENISRYIESGMKPYLAAVKGSREMVFPIIAMTLTLAAVYTPIAFTSGVLGSVFSEFALTLAGAVMVSGVVALTLTPMMCSRVLVAEQHDSRYGLWFNARFKQLQLFYQKSLSHLLAKRMRVVVVLCLVGCLGYGVYQSLPSELAPTEDRDEINVFVMAPHDASFDYTDAYVRKMEALYSKLPEATSYLASIGGNAPSASFQLINLKPWYKRFRSAKAIVQELNLKAEQFAGVTVAAVVPPPPIAWLGGGGSQGNNVEMAVMTAGEYKDLSATMHELILEAKKSPVFARVDNQLKWDRSQFEVTIDREKAADLNVPMSHITNTISTLLAGRTTGKFEYNGKQYDILLQMNQSLLANPNVIPDLYVRSDNHQMISLADLTTIHETTSPGSLPHFERLRADTLSASLAPGYTIADAIVVLEKAAKQILPDNMKMAFVGEARNYLEANQKILITFLLALCFIYFVLVAQFESFIDPLIILLTVPFAVIGALLLLKIAGGSLNIYSEIGLVTLIGLIAKHGILMTEFANQRRLAGMHVIPAIIEAATLRLRPILMTTAAMILGALPLALAFGAGSETRHQVGWVMVGGLLLGTFFSLIVVPVAYTYLSPLKRISPHPAGDTLFDIGS
jgi:multidrug efflux pump